MTRELLLELKFGNVAVHMCQAGPSEYFMPKWRPSQSTNCIKDCRGGGMHVSCHTVRLRVSIAHQPRAKPMLSLSLSRPDDPAFPGNFQTLLCVENFSFFESFPVKTLTLSYSYSFSCYFGSESQESQSSFPVCLWGCSLSHVSSF